MLHIYFVDIASKNITFYNGDNILIIYYKKKSWAIFFSGPYLETAE